MPFRGVGYENHGHTLPSNAEFFAQFWVHTMCKSLKKVLDELHGLPEKLEINVLWKNFFFKSKASTKGMKKQFLIYFSNIVHCVYLGMAHTLIQIQYSSSKCSFHAGNQIIPIFSSTGFEFFSEFTIQVETVALIYKI